MGWRDTITDAPAQGSSWRDTIQETSVPDVTVGTVAGDVAGGLGDAAKGLFNTVAHPIDTAKAIYHGVADPVVDTYNTSKEGGDSTAGAAFNAAGVGAVEAGKLALSFTKLGMPLVAAYEGVKAYGAAKDQGLSDDDAYAAGVHHGVRSLAAMGAAHAAPAVINGAGNLGGAVGGAVSTIVGETPTIVGEIAGKASPTLGKLAKQGTAAILPEIGEVDVAGTVSNAAKMVSKMAETGGKQYAIAHYITAQKDPAYAASLQKKDDK